MSGSRYAIFYAPEGGTALANFGWPWLGRVPERAEDASFPPELAADADHAARVSEPRLYGLHATLKPPFRLAADCWRADLLDAMRQFCQIHPPVEAPPLALGEIGGFIALRPSAPSQALNSLATDCVREFERFRAPLTAEDIAKRAARGLTPRQRELLDRYGYPYVMDEFRFHVTLTGRLEDAERWRVLSLLRPRVRAVEVEPLQIHSLSLFEQPELGARFVLAARIPFSG